MITQIMVVKHTGETLTLRRPSPARVLPFAGWLAAAGVASVTSWGWYWLAWIVAGFLVPELYCLFAGINGTLSGTVWHWERLDFAHPFDLALWTPWHWGLAVLVWGLFAWLSVHLPFHQLT